MLIPFCTWCRYSLWGIKNNIFTLKNKIDENGDKKASKTKKIKHIALSRHSLDLSFLRLLCPAWKAIL